MTSKPRTFYRGTDPGYTGPRILTGDATWDACLFVSSDRARALNYGPVIDVYEALPGTRILYEGTRDFARVAKGLFRPGTRMLPGLSETVRRAAADGYVAVWFKRQGDFGTAIMDRSAFRVVRREPAPDEAIRTVGGQPVVRIGLLAEPPLAREIFRRLEQAGLGRCAIFGGAVRDADCSAAWGEAVPIKDYDVRVWLGDASPSTLQEAVRRVEDAFGAASRVEPSLGTRRPRQMVVFKGIEIDMSFRLAPAASDQIEGVAIDRALDSDVGLSSVALAPDMTAWARPEYIEDRDGRTLGFFPISDASREAAYVARMTSKFPGLAVRRIERFPGDTDDAATVTTSGPR